MTSERKNLRQVLRVVVQQRDVSVPLHAGGEVKVPNRYYIVQAQTAAGTWRTVPMVDFDRLPAQEQEEIRSEIIT